jgi:hypothetical protein
MQKFLPMFDPSIDDISQPLTFSSADSPVRIYQQQGTVLDWKANVLASGGNSVELLARLDPGLFCWKMLQQSLLREEAEPKLLRRLPNWGTAQDGGLYRLLMQALPTSATDGFAWPTLTANVIQETVEQWEKRRNIPKNKKFGASLWVKIQMEERQNAQSEATEPHNGLEKQDKWATLKSRDWQPESLNAAEKRNSPSLTSQVQWATLKNRDSKGRALDKGKHFSQMALPNQVGDKGSKVGLALNPEWAEMLMGFPPGWTEID